MNRNVLGAVTLTLVAGVVVSGASCWRTMRFNESACTGGKHSLTGTFLPAYTSSCFGPRDEVIKVAVNGQTEVLSADSSPGTCVGQVLENARHIEPKYAAVTPTK